MILVSFIQTSHTGQTALKVGDLNCTLYLTSMQFAGITLELYSYEIHFFVTVDCKTLLQFRTSLSVSDLVTAHFEP